MRHRRKTVKLQRSASHRDALLANLACSLIEHRRIRTTLAKAKALRPYAEKLVTLAKNDSVHARRRAAAILGTCQTRSTMIRGKAQPNLQKRVVTTLFDKLAPAMNARPGGYIRIIKLGPRPSDSAPMAYIEWVDFVPLSETKDEEAATQ